MVLKKFDLFSTLTFMRYSGNVTFNHCFPILNVFYCPHSDVFSTVLHLFCFRRLACVSCMKWALWPSSFWLGLANRGTDKRETGR